MVDSQLIRWPVVHLVRLPDCLVVGCQSWVWTAGDSIFLASAYEGEGSDLYLAVLSLTDSERPVTHRGRVGYGSQVEQKPQTRFLQRWPGFEPQITEPQNVDNATF